MHIVLNYLELSYRQGKSVISSLHKLVLVSWLNSKKARLLEIDSSPNWVLGTCKNKAILGISTVLALESAVGLPLLRLLPTTTNPSSSSSSARL